MVDEIGNVYRSLDLLSQDLLDPGMVVTQSIDCNAGKQIEISLVGFVDQIDAAAAIGKKFVAGICAQQVLLFQFFYVSELHKVESLA